MTKLNRLSRPDGRLPSRAVLFVFLCAVSGCATNPDNEALVDPLKQRLLAREDIALQNLLLARTPAYSYAGSGRGGSYSYLDAPYDGPAIEPPLPDLNMLPEDMPPWEEFPEETPAPVPQPTPIEPVPTDSDPGPTPTPDATPSPSATPAAEVPPVPEATPSVPATAPETPPADAPPVTL